MVQCSFCGKEMVEGSGLMYVKKDAKIFYFCSKKCEKSVLKLKRKSRTTKWAKAFVKGEV